MNTEKRERGIAGQIFEYLKKTVGSLADSFKATTKPQSKSPVAVGSTGALERPLDTAEQRSTSLKRCLSVTPGSCQAVKKLRVGESSKDCGSPKLCRCGKVLGNCSCTTGYRGNEKSKFLTPGPNSDEHEIHRLNSSFNQLIWMLMYLKHNPLKTKDDVLEMITTMCKGVQEVLDLSHLQFSDRQLRRLLRVTQQLFNLIHSCEDNSSLSTMMQIYLKMEYMFDGFLDQFSYEQMNAEGQLRRYGFLSTLIGSIDDPQIRKILIDKLLLRINSTVTAMWTVCIFKDNSTVMNSDDINLFYFYCQLFEAAITFVSWEPKRWIDESVVQNLMVIHEAAGSLFATLPNLSYILHSTVLAASHYTKTDTSIVKMPYSL